MCNVTLPKVPVDPLIREFFGLLRAYNGRLVDFHVEAGISRDTVGAWRRGHSPSVSTLVAALNTLGYDLKIVRRHAKARSGQPISLGTELPAAKIPARGPTGLAARATLG